MDLSTFGRISLSVALTTILTTTTPYHVAYRGLILFPSTPFPSQGVLLSLGQPSADQPTKTRARRGVEGAWLQTFHEVFFNPAFLHTTKAISKFFMRHREGLLVVYSGLNVSGAPNWIDHAMNRGGTLAIGLQSLLYRFTKKFLVTSPPFS